MQEVTGSDGGSNKRQITHSDLCQFLARKCDDEMRELIAEQRKIIGSPVQKWFAEMQTKLSDPFNIEWGAVSGVGKSDGREPTEEAND